MKGYLNSMFIAIEAPDGVGKTTLTKNLKSLLLKNNYDVISVKEPYEGLSIGNFVRTWINKNDFTRTKNLTLQALYMFSASRIEMLDKIVLPALNAGKIVLCDRFAMSTAVYQNLQDDEELNIVISAIMNQLKNLIHVDKTIYMQLSPNDIISRINNRKQFTGKCDLLDERIKLILNEVTTQYNLMLSGVQFPQQLIGEVIRVDASKNENEIAYNVYSKIIN